MAYEKDNLMNCSLFEERLTDYLDKSLDPATHKAAAAHALACPLCHSLLNEVKGTLSVCKEIAEPTHPVTRLEAKILARTMPNAGLGCEEFEDHLTDYLDGFLPAKTFHRWERHAVLCNACSDLPGAVVRSLAAVVTYKLEELPVPAGLHARIMSETIGSEQAAYRKPGLVEQFSEWVRGLRFPIAVPQLAPVALMMLFAFFVFSQTVSADGSLAGVYTKSFELAEQTYRQGEQAFKGISPAPQNSTEPITGTTYVEDPK